MFFEGNAEFFGALADVFAIDAAGEGFVFEAFFYGVGFQIENAFRRANVGAGHQEAGEFVAGEERVFQRGLPRHVGVVGVRKDGTNQFFRDSRRRAEFLPLRRDARRPRRERCWGSARNRNRGAAR